MSQQQVHRYERVTRWAKRRYTIPGYGLILSVGGTPSRYTRIERLAWNRYALGGAS